MDSNRFDNLARGLAGSRRSLLGAAIAGVATLVFGKTADAALKRSLGDICRKHADCASGLCGPKDATGRQRCLCQSAKDCPAVEGICSDCNAGVCGPSDVCLEGCTGAAEADPALSLSFTPSTDPNFCLINIAVEGFEGCSSHNAEFWVALSSDGTADPTKEVDVPISADLSGAGQAGGGSYLNQGRWAEARVTLPSGQLVTGWKQIACPS